MHRALRIPELVELTFFQLISCPDTRKYDDRRTLARAARTSSLWTELALARLWSELACLAPLFLLLGPMQIIKRIIDNEDHDEEDGLVYAEEFVSAGHAFLILEVTQLVCAGLQTAHHPSKSLEALRPLCKIRPHGILIHGIRPCVQPRHI